MPDYGPSDPEFLERDTDRAASPSEYFPNFGVKLAILGWLTLAALGIAAIVLSWDFHHWAIGVGLAGGGFVAAAMLFAFVSERSPSFTRYSRFSSGLMLPDYDAGGPGLGVDMRVRRLAVLLLLTGLALAIIGIGLVVVTA
jgi:hypothetical protein